MNDMPSHTNEFAAFLSYSHHDADIATRLQAYIEHYPFPSDLRQRCPHLGETPGAVFRDESDLRPGEISQELRRVMCGCRHLIVLCTPHSAIPNERGKHYPEEGMQFFYNLNPESNRKCIIPLMYRGDAHASDEECLPPFIFRHRIPYIDVAAIGEERAFNTVVAILSGLHPQALWDSRNKTRRQKNRLWIAALSALFTMGVFVYSHFFMETEEIYCAYGWKGGEGLDALIPVGIPESRISTREFKRHLCAFVFTYRQGRLIRICHQSPALYELVFFPPTRLNNDGHHGSGAAAQIDFRYESDEHPDKVTSMIFSDAYGQVLLSIADDGDHIIRLLSGDSVWLLGNHLLGLAAPPPHEDGLIPFYRFARITSNEEGTMRVSYLDNKKRALTSEQGITGCELQLEKGTHRLLEGRWLGESHGIAKVKYTYVEPRHCGHIGSFGTYNAQDDLTSTNDPAVPAGSSVAFMEWDPHGNSMYSAFFASSGERIQESRAEFDKHGQLISVTSTFSEDKEAEPITLYQQRVDASTYLRRFRDSKGQPCCHPDGYAQYRYSQNNQPGGSNMHWEEYMDMEGNPFSPPGESYTKIYYINDEKHRRIEEGYLSMEDGKEVRMLHSGGYFARRWFYDISDVLKREEFYDKEGNVVRTIEH